MVSPGYVFPPDPKIDQTTIQSFESGFSVDEMAHLMKQLEEIPFKPGLVSSGTGKERTSQIKWIPREDQNLWIYSRLAEIAHIANKECYQFNLSAMQESIQYSEYYATDGGHYDWHMDIGEGRSSLRKLSIVIQLSDPSEYEGGEFQIMRSKAEPFTAPKKLHSVTIFPCFFLHRVTPVTKGTRKSLVFWVGGEPYK